MTMITIRFVRIVNLTRTMHAHQQRTVFGFESDTLQQNEVVVPGWPDVKAGALISLFFDQSGNWKTIQGWINHDTGEFSVKSIGYHKDTILRCVAVMLTLSFWGFPDILNTVIFLSLFFWVGLSSLKIRKLRQVRIDLKTALRQGKRLTC
ncbi:hypothetical protein ACO0K9_02210 [Undibacterium sp. Ji50W]|uniref:hypothetical protein n=1 Tax=Undibacterium sp. Ji50W TaxID=3413041 RepID=UPI003BF232D9